MDVFFLTWWLPSPNRQFKNDYHHRGGAWVALWIFVTGPARCKMKIHLGSEVHETDWAELRKAKLQRQKPGFWGNCGKHFLNFEGRQAHQKFTKFMFIKFVQGRSAKPRLRWLATIVLQDAALPGTFEDTWGAAAQLQKSWDFWKFESSATSFGLWAALFLCCLLLLAGHFGVIICHLHML